MQNKYALLTNYRKIDPCWGSHTMWNRLVAESVPLTFGPLCRLHSAERREENKLYLNGEMCYYITDKIWYTLLDFAEVAKSTVFLKGYKEFWQQVATAALLEFSTALRAWLYDHINLLFCRFMHIICDRLPRSMRREVYSFGNWVENLKPSNDLRLRVVKGEICAVIGGGAKVHREGATLFQAEAFEWSGLEGETLIEKTIPCGKIDPDYRSINIGCSFDPTKGKCHVAANTVALAEVDCNRDEFAKLYEFLTCVAKNRSGSLRSCASNNKVRVRGFRETVACYSKSGFPPVYELKLDNVIVE
ncbi:hypothetical protein SUGI_0124450 [Cryptomeria japonica]|nr:hypothetical protein SUGI_0124450 [Cryptomeria japonica]